MYMPTRSTEYLAWALDRLQRVAQRDPQAAADEVRAALLAEAQALADEDVALNQRMGAHGAALVEDGRVSRVRVYLRRDEAIRAAETGED